MWLRHFSKHRPPLLRNAALRNTDQGPRLQNNHRIVTYFTASQVWPITFIRARDTVGHPDPEATSFPATAPIAKKRLWECRRADTSSPRS